MFGTLYLLISWAIRLAMIPVVARRHRPVVAMAWLAPIFLLPVLGTLLYAWLSWYGLKRNTEGHRRVRREVERDDELREQERYRTQPAVGPDHRDLARLANRMSTRRLGGFPLLGGNAVEVLDEPGQAVDRLVADLDRARHHAHLMFYQYVNDETGRRVGEALARAAGRGVECRLLVDGWASRQMYRTLAPWLRRQGVEVHAALPLHPLRRPLARVDIRNHRKIAVTDGHVALTGSTNIHDPGHQLSEGIWHQISARVEGPAALQLQMLFVEDWYFATGQMLRGDGVFPEPEQAGEVPVQTVPDGPSYEANLLQHVLVQALQEAQDSVVLTTPYFIPDEPLELAVRLAALRGVQVDLVVPRRSDRRSADAAGRAYFDPLLDAGVRIHQHPSGLLHAKTITVDGQFSLLGTANLDRRSLFLNYELMLLLYDAAFTERLRRSQQRLLDAAVPVDPQHWRRRPERARVLEHTVRLLSPVL